MKSKIFLLAFVILLILALTGCRMIPPGFHTGYPEC